MDMLKGENIAEANLTDWRKLGQGLHARYVVGHFGAGARSSPRWARRATHLMTEMSSELLRYATAYDGSISGVCAAT